MTDWTDGPPGSEGRYAARGRYADDEGRYADDEGRHADDQGRYADDEGRYADDQGRHADQGFYADERPHPAADQADDDWYDDDDDVDGPGPGPGRVGAYATTEPGGRLDEYGHWVYDDDRPGGYGGAHARPRRPRERRHPVRAVVLALMIVVVVLGVGVFLHFDREINPGGHPGRVVAVAIPAGASTAQIGTILTGAGVIHGSSLFRYYVKLKGAGPLLPGSYHLAVNESYDKVIAALKAGPAVVTERLVIPEGFTLHQIAARVAAMPGMDFSASRFLAAATSGQVRSPYEPTGVDNLEGLVFPATYAIRQGMNETDVLQTLVDRFDQEAAALDLTQAAAALGMTPYQVVTVASIVEREAKLTVDRGPVASAIYNRLKVGMPLGADSTLVYALRQSDPTISITSIDYNQPNPYNTRLDKGLPPTPIANPGVPSLTAATSPPATTYLYFVETNPDGKLGFASTSSGFATLEAQCRQANLC